MRHTSVLAVLCIALGFGLGLSFRRPPSPPATSTACPPAPSPAAAAAKVVVEEPKTASVPATADDLAEKKTVITHFDSSNKQQGIRVEGPIRGAEMLSLSNDSVSVLFLNRPVNFAIDSETKFLRRTLLPPQELSRIMAEYRKKLKSDPGAPFPKTYSDETPIKRDELKKGDHVSVFPRSGAAQPTASSVVLIVKNE